ncbi:hypothetical protein ACOMHN_042262 [Nucella lapillus]
MDREGRKKGGVQMLIKNSILASEFTVDTNNEAEIHGIKITVDKTVITIFTVYCPQDKELSLQAMDIPSENCLVVGDFNSHSTCWGYSENDRRGYEVEDWQIESNLLLLNDPEDPPTFFSRRWLTTTTPDLAFATEDLAQKTSRKVQSQLAGSDHRPVLLVINLLYTPSYANPFPDGTTRRRIGRCLWASLTSTARPSKWTIITSTEPPKASTSHPESSLRDNSTWRSQELQTILDRRAAGN